MRKSQTLGGNWENILQTKFSGFVRTSYTFILVKKNSRGFSGLIQFSGFVWTLHIFILSDFSLGIFYGISKERLSFQFCQDFEYFHISEKFSWDFFGISK